MLPTRLLKTRTTRRLAAASVTAMLLLGALAPSALATHLTSITIDPPASATVAPGGTASYTGLVDGSADPTFCEYGWTLSATGQPAGSIVTFTPPSEPFGEGVNLVVTPFTLDITVPAGTAPGTYPILVTATWLNDPSCDNDGPRSATAALIVIAPCQANGGWFLQPVPGPNDPFDRNGDGWICTKDILGNGQGNSANSQRGPGQSGSHVDGHNHKDNG